MNKPQLIVTWVMGILLLSGCVTAKPISYEESLKQIGLEGVKLDLNGLSEKEIEAYFNECISDNKIFLYTGGYANAPLLDTEDFDFVWGFKTVSIGCTGGVPQGAKFNKLMLNYIKQNLSLARKLSDAWVGMSKKELKRRGYKKYLSKSFSPETKEEWLTFKRWWSIDPNATVTFYFKDDKIVRWEKSNLAMDMRREFSAYYSELLEYRKKPEVMVSSRPSDHNNCEAFRKIVKKGKVFIPFIIEKMKEGDFFLSQAMEEIIGFDVRVSAGIPKYVWSKEVSELWIKWWENNGDKFETRTITRHGLKYDAIEDDPKYKEVINKAEEEAEKNISNLSWPKKGQMGYCHVFWREKKRILKEKYGIDWKSPVDLNPYVKFD